MALLIPTFGNLDTDKQRAGLSITETFRRAGVPYTLEDGQYVVDSARIDAIENPFTPGISDIIRQKIAEAQKKGVGVKIIGEETEREFDIAA